MRDAIVTWLSVQNSDKAVPNFPFAHSIHFINKCTSSFVDFKSTLGQISSFHVKALIPVIILSLVILDIEYNAFIGSFTLDISRTIRKF